MADSKAAADAELVANAESEGASDEDILVLAKERFKAANDWESNNREKMVDDQKFAAATPDDPWQWPENIRSFRNNDPTGARPCLTINYLPQHINQVVNDTRQNLPSIKVLPVDDAGDVQVAKVLNGIIRHIENISEAEVAYITAHTTQVAMGIGYFYVCTDYVDDASFDQEIYIRRVLNPLTIYDDPAICDPTGADRKFLFMTEMLSPEEFAHEYPDADPVDWETQAKGDDTVWYQNGRIRVADYWTVERKKMKLHAWPSGRIAFEGDYAEEGVEPLRSRTAYKPTVICRKITGFQVLEEQEFPGCYIPFCRVVGSEFNIEGEIYIHGLVRPAKDAQRMYNYWASNEAEMAALQPRNPWVGYAGQFEGFEDVWKKMNIQNFAYAEANAFTEDYPDDGQHPPLPLPQRVAPPPLSQGVVEIKRGALNDIMATTGQYQPSLGKPSNEVSGRAIMYRNREGDVGTFHFADNLRRAIRFCGRVIIGLIPHVYDTPKRVVRILGEDGEFDFATLDVTQTDPVMRQAVQQPEDGNEQTEEQSGSADPTPAPAAANMPMAQLPMREDTIYNPSIGRYDVVVTTGPSYTTKRQEALDAMVQLIQAQPSLWQVIGDLLVKNMDWPGAEQMAARLRATLAPAIQQMLQSQIGGESDPTMLKATIAQMQMALQQAQQALQQVAVENEQLKTKRDEKVMEAQTKLHEADMRLKEAVTKAQGDIEVARITALGNIGANDQGEQTRKTIQAFSDGLQEHLNTIKQVGQQMTQPAQPPGAPAPMQTEERIMMPAQPAALQSLVGGGQA